MPNLTSIITTLLTANVPVVEMSQDYRRIVFINIVLFLLSIVLIFFMLFNFFVTHLFVMFTIDLIGFIISLFIAVFLQRTAHVYYASLMLLALAFVITFSAIETAQNSEYILVWLFFFPSTSFFLLGTRRGVHFSLLYISALIFYLFNISPEYINLTSKSNIIMSLLFFTGILFYYEQGREELFSKLEFTLSRLKGQKKLLKEISSTDKLTQLYNRTKLDEIFSTSLINARIAMQPLSIILVDIDRFKKVNDIFGHQVGDTVLKLFAQVLKNNIRSSDYVGRWGGEEFLIILNTTSLKQAENIAENLRKIIETSTFDPIDTVTASFGVASFDHEAMDEDEHSMFKRADECLYTVKREGRNGVLSENNLKLV